jgi:hypothetical protein
MRSGQATQKTPNECGATVSFSPQAADNCSGTVAVKCVPASESMFPIGTTVVLCTTADASSNSAACSFQVTVLGPQGAKSKVLAGLTVLRAGVTRAPERQGLDEAIRHLGNSLDPALWIDQTHLNRRQGERDFDEEKAAIQALCELLKDKRGTLPQAELWAFINRIIKADRLLALVTLPDAAMAGADRRLLARGWRELARGDKAVVRGENEAGIGHYREAWKHATGAESHPKPPQGEPQATSNRLRGWEGPLR